MVPPQERHQACFCSLINVLFFSIFFLSASVLTTLLIYFLVALIGEKVQLEEGVGVYNTASMLVSLLTACIDVWLLITTFEESGADIPSLEVFKVA